MQLQSRLENIELAQQYEMEVIKQNKKSGIVNPIKHDVLFPNVLLRYYQPTPLLTAIHAL